MISFNAVSFRLRDSIIWADNIVLMTVLKVIVLPIYVVFDWWDEIIVPSDAQIWIIMARFLYKVVGKITIGICIINIHDEIGMRVRIWYSICIGICARNGISVDVCIEVGICFKIIICIGG